jgi:hypothetical protein
MASLVEEAVQGGAFAAWFHELLPKVSPGLVVDAVSRNVGLLFPDEALEEADELLFRAEADLDFPTAAAADDANFRLKTARELFLRVAREGVASALPRDPITRGHRATRFSVWREARAG